MELEFTLRVNARHIPIDTYEKIKSIISWQIENDLFDSPFRTPELLENACGGIDPAFTHKNFTTHVSEGDNPRDYRFFETLSAELHESFGFTKTELRSLDITLATASINFNKILRNIDQRGIPISIYEDDVKIVFDSSEDFSLIPGLSVYW